jgi:hypothetical protein
LYLAIVRKFRKLSFMLAAISGDFLGHVLHGVGEPLGRGTSAFLPSGPRRFDLSQSFVYTHAWQSAQSTAATLG